MRGSGLLAFCLSLSALSGAVLAGPAASTALAFQATPPVAPAVATPAPAAPTAAPAAPTAPAAASPAAQPAASNVVTLVAWYANEANNAFLNILPLGVEGGTVGAPQPNAAPIGRAEFPDGGLPTLTINDTTFNAYLSFEGDTAEKWTWFGGEEGNRPATLVIQVEGVSGRYQGYFGTATFISRDSNAGGVLVLALRPPTLTPTPAAPAATEAPAAPTEATPPA